MRSDSATKHIFLHQKIISGAFILAAWIIGGLISTLGFDYAVSSNESLGIFIWSSPSPSMWSVVGYLFAAVVGGLVFGGLLAWALADMVPDVTAPIGEILDVASLWMLVFGVGFTAHFLLALVVSRIYPYFWPYRFVIDLMQLHMALAVAAAGGVVGILLTMNALPEIFTNIEGRQRLVIALLWSIAFAILVFFPLLLSVLAPFWYGSFAPRSQEALQARAFLVAGVASIACLVSTPVTIAYVANASMNAVSHKVGA